MHLLNRLKAMIPILLLFSIFLAGCDLAKKQKNNEKKSPKPNSTATKKNVIHKDMYLVNVLVADIRALPNENSEMVTQTLLADPVKVLDSSDETWYKIKVPDGYTGYIKKSLILKVKQDSIYLKNSQFAMVTVDKAPLIEATPFKNEITKAYLGTQLALISQEGPWLEVALPNDRRAKLNTSDAIVLTERDSASLGNPEHIVDIAKQYLGTPYLWGGITSQGIDCSGLTYYSYLLNGVKLPRDADKQFEVGASIEKQKDLKVGDLVFFATDIPNTYITHVGIYIGNGKFLHAANRKKGTIISQLNEENYKSSFKGGRRYLK